MLAAALAGCLDDFEPEVGPPHRPSCIDDDSDPSARVSFRDDIQAGVFARTDLGCVDCHTPQGATPLGLRASGLNLSSRDSLLRGGDEGGTDIVVPGAPCDSVLLQKVGPAPPFGARMPLDGPPFLDAAELQLLSDWIAEGADDT
jgi:hypothetical protein